MLRVDLVSQSGGLVLLFAQSGAISTWHHARSGAARGGRLSSRATDRRSVIRRRTSPKSRAERISSSGDVRAELVDRPQRAVDGAAGIDGACLIASSASRACISALAGPDRLRLASRRSRATSCWSMRYSSATSSLVRPAEGLHCGQGRPPRARLRDGRHHRCPDRPASPTVAITAGPRGAGGRGRWEAPWPGRPAPPGRPGARAPAAGGAHGATGASGSTGCPRGSRPGPRCRRRDGLGRARAGCSVSTPTSRPDQSHGRPVAGGRCVTLSSTTGESTRPPAPERASVCPQRLAPSAPTGAPSTHTRTVERPGGRLRPAGPANALRVRAGASANLGGTVFPARLPFVLSRLAWIIHTQKQDESKCPWKPPNGGCLPPGDACNRRGPCDLATTGPRE